MPAKAKRKAKPCNKRSRTAKREGRERGYPFGFREFARGLDVVEQLITQSGGDVDSCAGSDLGIFIYNRGSAEDRAEAFMVLMPIAVRLHERLYPGEEDDESEEK